MSYQCPICGGKGLQFHKGLRNFFVGSPDITGSDDDLIEVNLLRASKGIKPFEKDDCLTVTAAALARFRAEHLIEGHSTNDFAYLPAGCKADTMGCAAWPLGTGFGACALFDDYTYAGAAWHLGSDSRRYMHVAYRK
jgi:hypothetical protein